MTKREQVWQLMGRSEGCTSQEALELTGWPSISMQEQFKIAKANGVFDNMRKESIGGGRFRYFATKDTQQETQDATDTEGDRSGDQAA